MNPFEAILLQLTEAASAEFLTAFLGILTKKLAPPPALVVAPAPAPIVSAGILNGLPSAA